MLEAPAQSAKWKPHTSAESVLRPRGQLLPRTPSTMAGLASILQLQDELLHRIWTELPRTEDAADAGPRGSWRLCCRRFRDIVFKHGHALRWQAGGALSSLDALPALLTKFTPASGGSSSSLTQLCLSDAPLSAAHCDSLVNAAGKGTLDLLRALQLKCEESHPLAVQQMLGVVLGRCRHLTSLDLSRFLTFSPEPCSVCQKLLAVPPPSQPFAGLQALQLCRWFFPAEQLRKLRSALSQALSRLVSLDLELWRCDADNQPLLVDVCGAALASGTLRELNIYSLERMDAANQARVASLLQSHHCELTHLSIEFLTSATSLSSVLAHNSHLLQLQFACLWQDGEVRPSSDEIRELMSVLACSTSLTELRYCIREPHDPAPALRHLTRLTELGMLVEHGAAGPRFNNGDAMAEALQQMPHLRSLRINALTIQGGDDNSLLPSVIGRILQGCSEQLTSLEASAIVVTTDQPPFQQLVELGAALRRLTNLQALRLSRFVEPAVEELDACAAAATVAAALPHMTALTELDMAHFASQGDLCRIGVLGVVSAASMLPCLRSITLPGWLQAEEQDIICEVLEAARPSIEISFF